MENETLLAQLPHAGVPPATIARRGAGCPSNLPTLTQVSNIESMVGCLTTGHENEVGAYGNGGYPPNYSE